MQQIPIYKLKDGCKGANQYNKDIITEICDCALVDDEDFDECMKYRWVKSKGYAKAYIGKRRYILIHRIIMHEKKGEVIHHIDHNKLNNQKSNLRFCSHKENIRNQVKQKRNTSSKYKGVTFHKKLNKWQSSINVDKKYKYIGIFDLELDAAKAYNEAAIKYFGEFALLNHI